MNGPSPVGCDEVEPLLPLIADQSVDAEGEPAAFAHLAGCRRCQEALLRHDLVSLALVGTVIPATSVPQTWRISLPWALAAASLLVALGVLAYAWQQALLRPPGPDTEIVAVKAPDGRTVWVLRRNGQTVILDAPTEHQERPAGTPVLLPRN